MENKTQAERLIAIYNELDQFLQQRLLQLGLTNRDYDPFSEKLRMLEETGEIPRSEYFELLSYGSLRNAIVHRYGGGRNAQEKVIAEPLAEEVKRFGELRDRIMQPPLAMETIVIRKDRMYWVSPQARTFDVLKTMHEQKYSYVPVLEDQQLMGVFSQDTLFSFIAKEGAFLEEDDHAIGAFRGLLNIDNHVSERFEFMSRQATVAQVEEKFSEKPQAERRLEVIFFTERGKATEKILGLTTIWDLLHFRAQLG